MIYLNANLECEEALRAVEEAYARVADQNDVLATIVRDLSKSVFWNKLDECAICPLCDAAYESFEELDAYHGRIGGCPVGASRRWVAANPEDDADG